MIPGIVAGRAVVGAEGDPYWANVVSLLHFDGTDGSTTFTDQKGKTWTVGGSAQLDTAQAMFGPSSMLLSGSGGTLLYHSATSPDFDLVGDYTAECWMRPSSVSNNAVITLGTGNTTRITLGISNSLGLYLYTANGGGAVRISGGTISSGVWRHVAFTKASGTWSLFLDGSLIGTSATATFPSGSLRAFIGAGTISDTLFAGHIDEFRLTKGVARYTSSFTPSGPFPNS